jgi:predicted dehydrogenase
MTPTWEESKESSCSHAFPVFVNQPFLKESEQMVIADLGVHLLDTARYFFGEADYLYAQVSRVTPGVKGEDVATILITFENGCRCTVEVSVATRQEIPHFPQTLVHIEGSRAAAQEQMIGIAKAIVKEPHILILDEPAASITEKETRILFSIIRQLTAKGVGVIYI